MCKFRVAGMFENNIYVHTGGPVVTGKVLLGLKYVEGYTRLLIFKKFSPLPAVIWASPFINFQENF